MIYILDLDGTLIDSSKRHYILMEQVLEAFADAYAEDEARPFVPEEFMNFKAAGNSGKKYLTEVLQIEEETALRIMNAWGRKIESPEMMAYDCLYEDTLPFLEELKKRKDTILFLTARKNEKEVKDELKQLGIASYAKEVLVVDPLRGAQQKLEVVQNLLAGKKRNGRKILRGEVQKEDLCIVGDTENEYLLAQELELRSFILHRGFRSKEYWEKKQVISYEGLMDCLG